MTDIDLYGDHEPDRSQPPSALDQTDPDVWVAANRHLRSIARLERRLADVRRMFGTEIQLLMRREEEAIERIERDINWHRQPLVGLHAAVLEIDSRAKTLNLPSGQIKSRTPAKPSVNVFDPDAFVEWATVNAPHMLKTTVSINKAAIADNTTPCGLLSPGDTAAAVTTETGEMIPGIEYTMGRTTFKVEPLASTAEIDRLPEEEQ